MDNVEFGLMVTTVKYEQVLKIGDDIELMVKNGNRRGRNALLVIKAPKSVRIERTQEYKIEIPKKIDTIGE